MRDVATIWQEFLKIVREEAGSRVVETWFKAVRMLNWDAPNKVVHVEAPNAFVKSWISTHYMELFERHLSRLLNEPYVHIRFTHARKEESPSPVGKDGQTSLTQTTFQPARLSREHDTRQKSGRQKPRKQKASPVRIKGPLNSSFVFDSFVVGPSNTLAFSAAHAAAKQPGTLYNPLYICGSSGLGKTHLLQAVGNYLKAEAHRKSVLYQSADNFVSEFINAVRFNKVHDFEVRYKDVDILLFDDVQCIAHKEQTQEMFFHIFNTLSQANKQVVVTSDVLPSNMRGVNERVRSRLEGGLVADIQAPSLDMKVSILHKKAAAHNASIDAELAEQIASHTHANVRELEAALLRVITLSSLTGQPLNRELVDHVFDAHGSQQYSLDMRHVAHTVARVYQYSLADLRSSRRNKDLSFVRHVAMYCMKRYTQASLKEIAGFLSRKDHTTVMHACDKIDKQRRDNTQVSYAIAYIERSLMPDAFE